MPMGFKWSVYVAQTFVSSCLKQAFNIFRSSRFAPRGLSQVIFMVRDQAPFKATPHSPILLHMIDDVVDVTRDWPPEAVSAWHRITRNLLRLNKLPIAEAKSCHPNYVESKAIGFIGCVWDLMGSSVFPEPGKFMKIGKQVAAALSARTVHHKTWKRIVGRLVWFATLNRPLLSCTKAVFRTTRNTEELNHQIISETDKREIRMLTALLPFARVIATHPISTLVIAFDASLTAGAVTFTYVTTDMAMKLYVEAQEARHRRTESAAQSTSATMEVVSRYRWRKAFIHSWNRPDHINALEASTAVLALEWAARKGVHNARLIMLTDSLVTMGALQKGRSSAPALLVRCRRFGALSFAHGLRVCDAYVPSEHNLANPYTRPNSVGTWK